MISKSNCVNRLTTGLVAFLAVFLLLSSLCLAQQLTGTLIGTAVDSTGASVPNAKVTMKNEASGDIRTTLTNGTGYFSITAIQPGTYTVIVAAQGFKQWQQKGVVFNQGDNRNLPSITLQVGAINETVEISANELAVPTDNAEISTTLNTTLVTDVPMVGRDAGELIKLMPGAASTNGLAQGNAFTDKVVMSNTGPVGNYSINGTQPNGAMSFMLDGANLVDPGNMGTQIANINEDMVQEVKFLTSSYSAEYAKGPVIFQAFSKSGGANYHGEGYLYARNSALNSIDAYTKSQITNGATTAALAAPAESFYYIGGNVGGPVPLVSRGRNKFFFWGGYEYMRQHPAGTITNYNVPLPQQLGLDSNASNTFCPGVTGGCAVFNPAAVPSGAASQWGFPYGNPYSTPKGAFQTDASGNKNCGGTSQNPCSVWVMPASLIDPSVCGGDCTTAGVGLRNMYPTPNATPNAGNSWSNYTYVSQYPVNRWEGTGKVDYALGDNTKISFSYTKQNETAYHPTAIWWNPGWTLPYPSVDTAAQKSNVYLANFTHVFSPSTTNEFVFSYARYINPNKLAGNTWTRSHYNIQNLPMLFGKSAKQIPNIVTDDKGWNAGLPDIQTFSFEGGFNGGNTFGGLKKDPALYDNFTKVIGSHTLKVGMYWDTSENIQSSSNAYNGHYDFGWGPTSSGNIVMDYLLGAAQEYAQASAVPVDDVKFHQWSIYGQDQFRANRQLTLNYGLRLDHVGQWYGVANGIQVWNPGSYTNAPAALDSSNNCLANCNPGLAWHATNSGIPLSGYSSPLFYYEPRVGLAYDVFGSGKTVLRAGFALFRYQISTEVCNNQACDGPLGTVNYKSSTALAQYNPASPNTTGYNGVAALTGVPSGGIENGGSIGVLQRGDNRTPYTMDWNITISQQAPWRSVFELSYVANKTQNIFLNGSNSNYLNQNNVLPGGLFGIDPVTHVAMTPSTPTCGGSNPSLYCSNAQTAALYQPSANFNVNDFRPMSNYVNVYLMTHGGYSNYNSLQAGWKKQSGPVTFLVNYTFSKVLGTRDWNSDNGVADGVMQDPFSLKNNYGVLTFDHTQILNGSYVWNLPKAFHNNSLYSKIIDGWQLTGYTTYQSGAPLQPNTGGNLNAQYPTLTVPTVNYPNAPDYSVRLPNGLHSVGVNPSTWLGTNAPNALVPQIVCDPRNHASGLYFNPNCFAPPTLGQQGTVIWPYIKTPAYFDWDLGLFKNFQITERQKLQFRISAVNWLNHPLQTFGAGGTQLDNRLSFDQKTTVQMTNATTGTIDNVDIHQLAQTNQNPLTTGKPLYKTGNRTLTFAVKYFF